MFLKDTNTYVWVHVSVYMYVMCVTGARGREGCWIPVEFDLFFGSCHMDSGNQILVLCKSIKHFYHWVICLLPCVVFYKWYCLNLIGCIRYRYLLKLCCHVKTVQIVLASRRDNFSFNHLLGLFTFNCHCESPKYHLFIYMFQVGQEIEVRPGIVSKDRQGKLMCKPIFSKIVSLFAEHNDLQYAAPGGLIGKNFTLIDKIFSLGFVFLSGGNVLCKRLLFSVYLGNLI